LAFLMLIGCTSGSTSHNAEPVNPSDNSAISIQQQIESALQQTDPTARRSKVLEAVGYFLQDMAAKDISDEDASRSLTEMAFESDSLTLNDPAIVRRHENLAVVGLPDGMGLYVYDTAAPNQPPVLISLWTIGLNSANAIWRNDEIGLAYETIGVDGISQSHFALLTRDAEAWILSWISDDAPDWWFNSRNASLDIAPNLSLITVSGDSASTTVAFEEGSETPRRQFRLEWVRKLNIFQLKISPESYGSREAWMWASAIPSPYATLVEFVERLQRHELSGIAALTVGTHIIDDANSFGFYLTGVSYKVILSEPDRIIVQGRQGTFEFGFAPPETDGTSWKITQIKPTAAP
jgi:hypothetical protein